MVVQAASYEFCVKPAAALSLLYSGIPSVHKGFWEKKSPDNIYALHCQLSATPGKVIAMLDSTDACTPARERILWVLGIHARKCTNS